MWKGADGGWRRLSGCSEQGGNKLAPKEPKDHLGPFQNYNISARVKEVRWGCQENGIYRGIASLFIKYKICDKFEARFMYVLLAPPHGVWHSAAALQLILQLQNGVDLANTFSIFKPRWKLYFIFICCAIEHLQKISVPVRCWRIASKYYATSHSIFHWSCTLFLQLRHSVYS